MAPPPPKDFLCQLSGMLMTDPMINKITGHRFQRTAILEWIHKGNNTCPVTGNAVSILDLVVDDQFREKVELWQEQNSDAEDCDDSDVGVVNDEHSLDGSSSNYDDDNDKDDGEDDEDKEAIDDNVGYDKNYDVENDENKMSQNKANPVVMSEKGHYSGIVQGDDDGNNGIDDKDIGDRWKGSIDGDLIDSDIPREIYIRHSRSSLKIVHSILKRLRHRRS